MSVQNSLSLSFSIYYKSRAPESKKYIYISIYSLCVVQLITHVHSIEDSKSFLISFTRFLLRPVIEPALAQIHKRIERRKSGIEREREGVERKNKIWNQKWIEPIRKTENKYRKKYWVNVTNGWNHKEWRKNWSEKKRITNTKSPRRIIRNVFFFSLQIYEKDEIYYLLEFDWWENGNCV